MWPAVSRCGESGGGEMRAERAAWGAVQATAAGLGMALGGMMRDGVALISTSFMGYSSVYLLEIVLLAMTLWAVRPLIRRADCATGLSAQ